MSKNKESNSPSQDEKIHPDDYRLKDGRWMRRTFTSNNPAVKTFQGPPCPPGTGQETEL